MISPHLESLYTLAYQNSAGFFFVNLFTFSDDTNIPRSGSLALERASVTFFTTIKKTQGCQAKKMYLCGAEIGHHKDMLSPISVIAW